MIARALVQETGVVLLDEPTSNLDVCHQMGVMEVLRSLAEEEGLAVVIALHDLNLAATYCRRLMVLSAGSVLPYGYGTPEEMLRNVYGIEAVVKRDRATRSCSRDCAMLSSSFGISLPQHAFLATEVCEACGTTWRTPGV